MSRTIGVPAGIFDSRPYGFAQVAIVPTPFGRAIHVSGQVAWDADQNIVGAGDVGRQLEKSLENLDRALRSAGATLDQIGALRLYIRQSHLGEGKAIARALKSVFGDNPPCSTWIGVPGLARDEFLVEVEPSPVYLADSTAGT
jgi:enamine deaminase RidA (YjgF/YER057c/UK114 family)